MAGASFQGDGPESKRRKVRKGTQSCWECKRRKVRCIFAATTDAICENCQRRGAACISQEHADEPVPSGGGNQVETRLGRVEEIIEHLVHNNAIPAATPKSPSKELPEGHFTHLEPAQTLQEYVLDDRGEVTATSPIQSRRITGKYEDLSQALIAAWPSQHDVDLICTLQVGLSAHLHIGLCVPYSCSMGWDPPSPRDMLQLPPPGSHPVLIARKLLMLGTFLQGICPYSIQNLGELGSHYRDIMSRVVDTAISLVTTNEDLIASVEGIECVMMEAMYQNYSGNIQRAWMAARRATTVAQVMALHRGLKSPSLKILDPETRAAFNPDQICFRLVEMDCYLSLMLGLPWTTLEARFATPKALEGCQPVDRMQRIHCAMAGRILQRNENNFSETHDIDTLLQKAAAEMPPQWWLMPDLSARNSSATDILHQTIRLMDQFTHYHLLIRLHLPYMLRSSLDGTCKYDHSKMTAVNVSRETLARFVAFRASNNGHYYCRGTDFLAFIATTVLCIAHIDSRGRLQGSSQTSVPGVFNFLAHSRPCDRGLMERTLDIIESVANADTNAIAFRIARVLDHLLAIEANAASGTRYSTNTSKSGEEVECISKLTNTGLHVRIPYLGTINFERSPISKRVSAALAGAPQQDISTTSAPGILPPNQLDEHNQQPPPNPPRPEHQANSHLDHQSEQTAQLQVGPTASLQESPYAENYTSTFSSGNIQEKQLPVSVGRVAGVEDDWDLQGVDVALFDSLFRETAIPDAAEEETWEQWANIG